MPDPLSTTLDRVFLAFAGLVAAWVALKPGQIVKILNYGKASVTDVPPCYLKTLRYSAAFVAIGALVVLVGDLW